MEPSKLVSHLKTQLERNCIHFPNATASVQPGCPNGLVALTGRFADSPLVHGQPAGVDPKRNAGSDLQVWEMGPPNHATLGIHLDQPVDQMLEVFEASATSYSRRINDQWNTAGLKDTAGCKHTHSPLANDFQTFSDRLLVRTDPTATSHYGMHMVSWHIPLALSGQQANLPNRSLTYAPKLKAPYSLPMYMPGVFGVLSSPTVGRYSLRLTVGELELGLLAVDGHAAPGAVRLAAGGPPMVWS